MFVGTCHNHKQNVTTYKFNNFLNLEEIKHALEKGEIHKCSECLVLSLLKINDINSTVEPICLMPLCEKNIGETLKNSFIFIYQYFKKNNASVLMNIATDGDSTRRNVLNELREPNYAHDGLKTLPLFEQNMLFGECGTNFDPKHGGKRFRGTLISDHRSIRVRKVSITKQHIEMFYKGTRGNKN